MKVELNINYYYIYSQPDFPTVKYTISLVVLFFFFAVSNAHAQKIEKKKMRAESLFYTEKFEKARLAYEELRKLDPSYKTAIYRVEICSLLTISPNKSPKMLEGYAKTQGRKDKFYHYWMGMIYFNQGHYKKSIEACERFYVVNQYKTKAIRDEVKELQRVAELRYYYFKQPFHYDVTPVSGKLNSGHNEYSPVYSETRESLLFLSSHRRINFNSKNEKFHVFEAQKIDGEWHAPRMIHHLHTFSQQNISINLIHDLNKLYVFTDKEEGHLQYSEFRTHRWSTPIGEDMNIQLSELTSHFFMSEQENRMLFSKPVKTKEGVEHLDIFQSFKDSLSGRWSEPKIFSDSINSDMDEDFPFLSHDGNTLYFSSKGHTSMGGFDIFKSEFDNISDTWSKPEALKNPVNSIEDDIQYKVNEDLITAYYVSNKKESKGGYDIYFSEELDKTLVSGSLTDANGGIIAGARLVFNSVKNPELFLDVLSDKKGQYKLKVNTGDDFSIEIWLEGERIHKDKLTVPTEVTKTGALVYGFGLSWRKEGNILVTH